MYATSKLFILLTAILLYTQANAGVLRAATTTTTTTTQTTLTNKTTRPATTESTTKLTTKKTTAGIAEIEKSDALPTTTATTVNESATTYENTEATFLPKDIDEKLLTSVEKDENAEEEEDRTKSKTALSRDEDASIKVAAIKNPDVEVLKIDTQKSDDAESAKLLLSSLPKSNEKTRELEENIEEAKETNEENQNAGTIEKIATETTTYEAITTTTTEIATTTTTKDYAEETTNDSSRDSNSVSSDKSNETTRLQIVQEMEQQPHVDNAASAVLEVETPDGDYVILDEYEHLEQDVHYAPVVHSIEIVPARLEGELLEDFVHHW